jgi:hypothetical protein
MGIFKIEGIRLKGEITTRSKKWSITDFMCIL